jgi:Ni/Co efflux regulator RcnB
MKKIIVSSILAATACLSMVGQANAAPNYSQHHASQVQHQKHGNKADSKADSKHKVVKNKAKDSHYRSKAAAAKYKVKGKYQGKNTHEHRS